MWWRMSWQTYSRPTVRRFCWVGFVRTHASILRYVPALFLESYHQPTGWHTGSTVTVVLLYSSPSYLGTYIPVKPQNKSLTDCVSRFKGVAWIETWDAHIVVMKWNITNAKNLMSFYFSSCLCIRLSAYLKPLINRFSYNLVDRQALSQGIMD